MSKQLSAVAAKTLLDQNTAECRVAERHSCELVACCQPSSGESIGSSWPATILDISLGGIRLLLRRRFEPKAILAIELSGAKGTQSCTGIAKVVHVASQGNGTWILGCKFFNGLTDDELHGLLPAFQRQYVLPEETRGCTPDAISPSQLAPSPLEKETTGPIAREVHFRIEIPTGELFDCIIRRLNVPATWPLAPGKILTMFTGNAAGSLPPFKLQVVQCRAQEERWSIRCRLVDSPSPALLQALGKMASPVPVFPN